MAREPQLRTAVVSLVGTTTKAERLVFGEKLMLMPGEGKAIQIFPQYTLEAGSNLTIEAPGFYLESVSVGQKLVAQWARGAWSLPRIELGTVVTVQVFRVEDR